MGIVADVVELPYSRRSEDAEASIFVERVLFEYTTKSDSIYLNITLFFKIKS